jgi:hypothetical protein
MQGAGPQLRQGCGFEEPLHHVLGRVGANCFHAKVQESLLAGR